MAYVGTPSRYGSDLETLASILQGEAGGEGLMGLQAVADVIRNRASQNFSGYGSGLLDQALARNQFQGQSSKIGPEARQVAEQLQSGTLPDVAGDALYYANPGASTASWARRLNSDNALKIGNHYFTDNARGVPFSAQAPAPVPPDGPKGQEAYLAPLPSRTINDAPIAAMQQGPEAPHQGLLSRLTGGKMQPPQGLMDLMTGKPDAGADKGGGLLGALAAMQPQEAPQIQPMQAPQGPTLADYLAHFMQSRMA
ncbi:cell wall hydrolase [Mesorhizobium sp. B2-1-3]|uniref:cell wall hydrolase n=1 Tax=Mesorhizobium sp. B2-1-3 TaxID=2589972 RepID=UPI00112A11B7|nr:cell wall hydrolase [Mesorhizobium sp. B2-1-3]TPN03804.1 cell wall hydrolase [Mesorhizobium sp. B2-1-3]